MPAVIRVQLHCIYASRFTFLFTTKYSCLKVIRNVPLKRCHNHWTCNFLLKHKYPKQLHGVLHISETWADRHWVVPRNPSAWHFWAMVSLHQFLVQKLGDPAWWGWGRHDPASIFFLFSSRLAQLCKDCLWACSASGYPVWLSPIPTWSSSSKQINMFTATHDKSPSFWLKEAEGLMLSPSMAWEASRISFWPFLTYSLHGDFSAPLWLEQFLTVCGKTHINLSPVK